MSNKSLFLTLLLGSFLISNLFWLGAIDQDFYLFYYIGRDVSEGYRMYADFADNKGPILYIFFALLYFIFRENYGWALVFGSTIIDALSLFVIFKILERDFKFVWFKNKILNLLFIIFCLALYKSFSIGSVIGGLYSENLGMLLLVLGLWALGKKNSTFSGLFFALSVLSRLTYLFFAPFFLVLLIFNFKDKYKLSKQLLGFLLGGLFCLSMFILYFWHNGELNSFFYNVFSQNAFTAKELGGGIGRLLASSIFVSLYESRIIITLITSALVIILKIFSKEKFKNKAILITLLGCSFISVFVGGVGNIFYYHQFFQFNLMAIVVATQFKIFIKLKELFLPIIFLLTFFIFLNYYSFAKSSQNNISKLKIVHPNIPEIKNNRYLIVIPYYPLYYIVYGKSGPNKFSQITVYSSHFLINSEKIIKQYRNMDRQKLQNTTFMFVNKGLSDKQKIEEYKNIFGKEFKLKKVNTYHDLDATIEVYESSKKN